MPGRVLVVDDDPTVVEVVRRYLVREGHEVLEAADGVAGIDAWRAGSPDLIILDLLMPGRDGLDVCREIRSTSDVPIIMLTALGVESDGSSGSSTAGTTTSSSRSAHASWC